MLIRLATPRDFPAIFGLMEEFSIFQQTPEKLLITPEVMHENKGLFNCLVAETDKVIVGFASFFYAYYSWSGKALYLDDLYVKKDYRGQGLGLTLFNAVKQVAQENNCLKMRWQVSRWNAGAIAFYTKMGAITDDVEINCDLNLL